MPFNNFYISVHPHISIFTYLGANKNFKISLKFSGTINTFAFLKNAVFLGFFRHCFLNISMFLALKKEARTEICHCFFLLFFLKFGFVRNHRSNWPTKILARILARCKCFLKNFNKYRASFHFNPSAYASYTAQHFLPNLGHTFYQQVKIWMSV